MIDLKSVEKLVRRRKSVRQQPPLALLKTFDRYKWTGYARPHQRETWHQMALLILLLIDLEEDLNHEQ